MPVTEVDESVRISPFSKVPAKVMVLGVVASDGKKCPIIFIPDGERSPPTAIRRCFAGT